MLKINPKNDRSLKVLRSLKYSKKNLKCLIMPCLDSVMRLLSNISFIVAQGTEVLNGGMLSGDCNPIFNKQITVFVITRISNYKYIGTHNC